MWTFRKRTEEKMEELSAELLSRRAANRIITVITIGTLLLLFDFFVGFDFTAISLLKGEDGAYLMRPDEGASAGHILLTADIKTDKGRITRNYEVSLYPYARENGANPGEEGTPKGADSYGAMSEEELLAYEMRAVISSLNDDQSVRRVSLPDRLRTGEEITWSSGRKTNTAAIVLGILLLSGLIYKRRLDPLEQQRRIRIESITRQLPEFVNRLVLLLGAGLVLSSAFEHIVEETSRTKSLADDYFYSHMADIYNTIKETNGSMDKEFKAFARSCESSRDGCRELMRISNIISDNISKGVELTDKLQSESESLWLSRKRNSEERGRLAETKLTMPLTVFLLVLVVITVSPALLEL